jgi:hypothetical protein
MSYSVTPRDILGPMLAQLFEEEFINKKVKRPRWRKPRIIEEATLDSEQEEYTDYVGVLVKYANGAGYDFFSWDEEIPFID